MEEHAFVFNSLLIITLLAFFVPLVLDWIRRVRIPFVVGEIIAGMIVGRSGLNIVHPGPYLEFISTFGLTYLMFLSGLEIDFDLLSEAGTREAANNNGWLRRMLRNPVVVGVVMFATTLAGAYFVSLLLRGMNLIRSPYLMTLIISTTSLAVVVPVLKQRGISNTVYGQTVLVATLIADFATMLLITIAVALIEGGFTLEVFLILVLFAAVFIFYRLGIVIRKLPFAREVGGATVQIKIRGAFALILVFIGLTQQVGVEIILGAFLAGVILSLLSSERETETHHKLEAFGYGFFIPIFFILVGVNFDVAQLLANPEALYLVALLLVAAYVLKLVPALLLRVTYSWHESIAAGFLMSSRLSLIIAAAAIGLRIGAITEAVNSAVVLVALVSVTLSPIVFDRILPRQEAAECECVTIVGATRQASLLANRLLQHQEEVVMIDNDPVKVDGAQRAGMPVVLGDGTSTEDLRKAGAGHARTLVAVTGSDEVNMNACRVAREQLRVANTIALIHNAANVDRATELGITVVTPDVSTLMILDQLVRHPSSYEVLAEDNRLRIADIQVRSRDYAGRLVRDVSFPGDSLVVALMRGREKIVPHGNTALQLDDTLTLLGTPEELAGAREAFEERA